MLRTSSNMFLYCALIGMISAAAPPQSWKTEMLDTQNAFRRSVVPNANNMAYMSWDDRLATLAQQAAERCKFEHNYDGDYASLGENIYKGGHNNAARIANLWFQEREMYRYPGDVCNLTLAAPGKFKSSACGHYTQMVSYTVIGIGCGSALCSGDSYYLVFCEYSRGNRKWHPYLLGDTCSACAKEHPYCKDGMCVKKQDGAECKVKCKNCGMIDTDDCTCACGDGFQGDDCSVPYESLSKTKCPDKCIALGTPCLNGGKGGNSNTTCECTCPAGFSGPYCEVTQSQITNGVNFAIRGKMYDDSTVPVDPYKFKKDIFPSLQNALAAEISKVCSSQERYKECCPTAQSAPKIALGSNTIQLAGTYPRMEKDGDLRVAIYVNVSTVSPSPCPGVTSRGVASLQTQAYPPISILQPAVETVLNTSSVLLPTGATINRLACCHVTGDNTTDVTTPGSNGRTTDNRIGGRTTAKTIIKTSTWSGGLSPAAIFAIVFFVVVIIGLAVLLVVIYFKTNLFRSKIV